MSFFDIVLDFILMDAFEDLENPPSSVLAVLRNRWLSDSFKETVCHRLSLSHTSCHITWAVVFLSLEFICQSFDSLASPCSQRSGVTDLGFSPGIPEFPDALVPAECILSLYCNSHGAEPSLWADTN